MYQKSEYHLQNAHKARLIANSIKCSCQYCNRQMNKANIKKHEHFCFLNPINKKLCPVCNEPIKKYKTSATCGYSCANKLFRSGPNNGMWKDSTYQTTCFHYHKKECVVCGEKNIVTVHHLDENHSNNTPSNLIPLCPTHHHYWHSKYKHLIEPQVLKYINSWKESNVGLAGFEPANLLDPNQAE